jgi:hypothetical protein
MVKTDYDFPVTCGTCGKPAIRRVFRVSGANGIERRQAVDCHANCMASSKSHSVVQKANKVVADIESLREEFRVLQVDEKRLTYGTITDVDLLVPIIDSCAPKTMVKPQIVVRAFGLVDEIELDPVDLAEITLSSLLAVAKPHAEILVANLKARFDRGDF